jgi:hypothetical protein
VSGQPEDCEEGGGFEGHTIFMNVVEENFVPIDTIWNSMKHD